MANTRRRTPEVERNVAIVLARLDEQADAISDALCTAAEEGVPQLPRDDGMRELMRIGMRDLFQTVFHALAHSIDATKIAGPASQSEYARTLARRNVPISTMMRGHRLGQRRLAEMILAEIQALGVEPEIEAAVAETLASVLPKYVDLLSQQALAAHQDERNVMLGHQDIAFEMKVRDPKAAPERLAVAALDVAPTPVYQPIVSLPDGATAGFEALARWPSLGDPDPQRVCDVAKADPVTLAQFDERCITAALDAFLAEGDVSDTALFINTFPSCEFPSDAVDARAEVLNARRVHLVFELTETQLLDHPRTLMSKVESIRRGGWTVAFDDVGVNTVALPLLDVVKPEIVKLDVGLVQSEPHDHESRVMAAVSAYQERTKTVILAEGVETTGHYARALAWGATLGQGYRFARPGPSHALRSTAPRQTQFPSSPRHEGLQITNSPFESLIAAGVQPHRVSMSTFQDLARDVRTTATLPENPSIVIVVLPDDDRFRLVESARRRLEVVVAEVPFFALFGCNLPLPLDNPSFRLVAGTPSDPLSREVLILALGPHGAVAVVGRGSERGQRVDSDSGFACAITHDREHVTALASHLLARIP